MDDEFDSLYEIYSDVHKDAYGFRPRGHVFATLDDLRYAIADCEAEIVEQLERQALEDAYEAQHSAEQQRLTRMECADPDAFDALCDDIERQLSA